MSLGFLAFAEKVDELVEAELRQLREEGYVVSGLRDELERVGARHLLLDLALLKEMLPKQRGYGYVEPTSIEEILAARPKGWRYKPFLPSEKELREKVLGGWVGRAAGCMLGKPVEGWSRSKIRERLEKAGEYPLMYYFPAAAFTEGELDGRRSLVREGIKRVERDDDIDYTILNLLVYEDRGPNFTAFDIADAWLRLLPYMQVYTAERAAYRNLILGLKPPATAVFLNPYREWIGAQIRADLWGYVNPCEPERAATMAYRDACISHMKNGVYGEMFVAACIAAAFSADDLVSVVRTGLSQIPADSRYAEAVRRVIDMYRRGLSWEAVIDKIEELYGNYHPVHVINNAAVVVAALLWSEEDFSKAITLAVMGGWDTDCNGATVGSIMGVYLGFRGIPEKWWRPLNDTVRSGVFGMDCSSLKGLAERTVKAMEKWGY